MGSSTVHSDTSGNVSTRVPPHAAVVRPVVLNFGVVVADTGSEVEIIDRRQFGIQLKTIAAHIVGIDQAVGVHIAAYSGQLCIVQIV